MYRESVNCHIGYECEPIKFLYRHDYHKLIPVCHLCMDKKKFVTFTCQVDDSNDYDEMVDANGM